jgi:hypothetical protein
MRPARIAAPSHRSFPTVNAVLRLPLQTCRQLSQRLFSLIMSRSERFLLCPLLALRLRLRLLKTTLQRKRPKGNVDVVHTSGKAQWLSSYGRQVGGFPL